MTVITVDQPARQRPADWTARCVVAALLVVLNLVDVVITKLNLSLGAAEGNPVMLPIIEHGVAPFALKFGIPLVAGYLLLRCPERSRVALVAAVGVVGLYLAVNSWNLTVLAMLHG